MLEKVEVYRVVRRGGCENFPEPPKEFSTVTASNIIEANKIVSNVWPQKYPETRNFTPGWVAVAKTN